MAESLKANGRLLAPGVEVSITGERGRFTFHGVNRDGSLSVYGGKLGHEAWRAFCSDRIKRVHRTHKRKGTA
jgi:hypothetical protein